MPGESVRANIAECVATLTPIGVTSEGPIQFGGEVAFHEAAFLGDVTPKYERGQRYLSAAASNDVVMMTNSRAGTRDMNLLMGTDIDRLTSWAQRNPMQMFNLDFFYKLFTDTANLARIQRDKTLYKDGTGVYSIQDLVKEYVKGVFGAKAIQYKQMVAIKFTKPKKLFI